MALRRTSGGSTAGPHRFIRVVASRKSADASAADRNPPDGEARALATLNEWSSRLWRCASLDQGLELMLDAVIELLGASKGNIQLRDGSVLHMAAHRGFERGFVDFFREVSAERSCGCARVLRTGEVVIIEDVEADADYAPNLAIARESGYRALVSTPILAADGTVIGVFTTHFPTAHRPTETELRRMELYVRQASDFIHRCRIEEALREADRRKNEFLALLAHELRSPLAPIRSGLQVMKLAKGDPMIVEQTRGMMERQMDLMVRLVDDLTDVSRIGRGKIELRLQVLDLNRIVDRAVEACRARIESEGHELAVRIPFAPIAVCADDVRLTQIFVNLLNNAAKYTPSGGAITISVERNGGEAIVGWPIRESAFRRTCSTRCSTCSPSTKPPSTGPRAGWASACRW